MAFSDFSPFRRSSAVLDRRVREALEETDLDQRTFEPAELVWTGSAGLVDGSIKGFFAESEVECLASTNMFWSGNKECFVLKVST